jgi:hypothetical protein
LLGARAGDVHDGRFAADCDRFLHAADAQVGVHRCNEATGQLDAVALDRVEAG